MNPRPRGPAGVVRLAWFAWRRCRGKDVDVAQIDPPTDAIIGLWFTIPEVAERLDLRASRVKQYLRDHKLLGVQRPDGSFGVPAAFLDGNQADVEAMRWLFTSDDSLPGSPIEAIAAHRCSEVNRRAQALAI